MNNQPQGKISQRDTKNFIFYFLARRQTRIKHIIRLKGNCTIKITLIEVMLANQGKRNPQNYIWPFNSLNLTLLLWSMVEL